MILYFHYLKIRVGDQWVDACPIDEEVSNNGGQLWIRVGGEWVQARDYLKVRVGSEWLPIHEEIEDEGGVE